MNPVTKIFKSITSPTPSWERMMAMRRDMDHPDAEKKLARFIKRYGIAHIGGGGGGFLHAAALNGRTRLVEVLLDAGMDINEPDNGSTVLYHAIIGSRSNANTVELLLERGADINEKGTVGWRPLHTAAGFEKPEVFMLLLKRGADVNIPNDEGVTPLMHAASCGRKGMVAQLVRHGANIGAKDHQGRTAADYAGRGRQDKIYDFLQRHATRYEAAYKGVPRAITAMKPLKLKPLHQP